MKFVFAIFLNYCV